MQENKVVFFVGTQCRFQW